MALALYRKYRPKLLSDLIGKEMNVDLLKNAAGQNRLGHAYLFYGSRGAGKNPTTLPKTKIPNRVKRIADAKFAKLGEPCNECISCKGIDSNSSFDVIEIDAASNRGIDEIRNIKDSIRSAPVGGRYKDYIINEGHMLNGCAFDALLKTLEEPPAHAVLVLATTEYEKLPATITSRVQRFLFKKQPKTKIMEKLAAIAKAEKIDIEPAALELVAAAGEGSFRDAESLLDQIASLASPTSQSGFGSINLETAERLTGRVGLKKVEEFASLIIKNDLKGALDYLAAINEEGHNLVQLIKDLIHYLWKVLSLKLNPGLEKIFQSELTTDEIVKLKKLAMESDVQKTIKLIKSFIRAYSEMRYSPFAIVPLEVCIAENLS